MQPEEVPSFDAFEISKSYSGRIVLDRISLSVPAGSIVGLLGANGSGKTTLLRVLLGLVAPDGGAARISGADVAALPAELRARVGYVPQSSELFGWLDGHSMLRYFGAFFPDYDPSYAHSLADRLQVSLRTVIGALSPGQQQRLSLVRALSTRPDYLVLDEPMAALDPAARMLVIEELLREHAARGVTMLVSSHIITDLERYCSHLAVIARGRVALFDRMSAFARLVRVSIPATPGAPADGALSGAVHVRSSDTDHVLVIRSESLDDLRRSLPAEFPIRELASDLEAVLSEWMR